MIVLDASVVIKLVVKEPGSELVFHRLVNESDRIAPDLCHLEVAAALSKKVRYNSLDAEFAVTVFDKLSAVVTRTYDMANLIEPAFRLSVVLKHALQDCIYLALAREHGCVLLTADTKFAASALNGGHEKSIELIAAA